MEDLPDYFIPTAFLIALLLLAYTFREGLTDIIYVALNHWKHTLFIVTCVSVGLFVGGYNAHLGSLLDEYNLHISIDTLKKGDDERIAATISVCKTFVEAKLDGRTDFDEAPSLLDGIIKIGTQSYWDTCANTFGMNYWKHEIFIRGEEGGHALCKAYRHDTYRSGNVESWCATVFAQGQNL